YGREQDLFEPLHYLPLLEQRPGAFDYAKPMRQWRKDWPESYDQVVRVLRLHEQYPAHLVQQAIEQALAFGCPHLDGVLHCLHQLSDHAPILPSLLLDDHALLHTVGTQPIDLSQYEQLLRSSG